MKTSFILKKIGNGILFCATLFISLYILMNYEASAKVFTKIFYEPITRNFLVIFTVVGVLFALYITGKEILKSKKKFYNEWIVELENRIKFREREIEIIKKEIQNDIQYREKQIENIKIEIEKIKVAKNMNVDRI